MELRRRYYLSEKIKENPEDYKDALNIVDTYRELHGKPYEGLIYKFASNFMNQNADRLYEVMNWNDKWTFEEEN